MADVFVSYSRRDQEFVRRLHGALVAAGREVWVDWEGIPPSAKWMDEVKAAIDGSGLFLFVVSPDSAASPVCRDEATHAASVGKRIVPVVWRDTPPARPPGRDQQPQLAVPARRGRLRRRARAAAGHP